ncbi:hypothetical protein T439DRAFT_325683 [Meredithblackwellia eburnea MCA 4105]
MSNSSAAPVASTSKSYNISASSFLDLKAELNKREDEFEKTKHLGSTTTGVKRGPPKKPSVWAKRNKGIDGRNQRDQVLFEEDPRNAKHDPARLRAQMEKKAALYEKIRKGKTGGLNEAQIESLLVDFDQKDLDGSSGSDDSEDEDESATVPQRPIESDPLVEWTDEFGRTRMIPASEVPRSQIAEEAPVDESNVHYGDQRHFPVYEPDPAVLLARAKALAESEPLVSHYDGTAENRTKAAGFYAFSRDEKVRAEQMAALKRERDETEVVRRENRDKGGVVGEREREKEERKRKLEEKRKELERKRAEKLGGAKT